MRYSVVGGALALTLLTVSTTLHGQRPDDQIDGRSLTLLQQARDAKAAGNLERATDLLETSVAVDPRNRQAFEVLAQVERERGLPGRAIRLYRQALALEPNDLDALAGQGEALMSKGAVNKAKENLAKIRALCSKGCTQATELSAAIDRGPPVNAAVAQAQVPPNGKPVTQQ